MVLACAALAMGAVAMALPSMAATSQPPPVSGSVAMSATVGSTLTFTLSATSFNLGNGSAGGVLGEDNGPAQFTGTVQTNDPSGYAVSFMAQPFTATDHNSIPDTAVFQGVQVPAGGWIPASSWQSLNVGTGYTAFTSGTPSAGTGDVIGFATQINVPSSQPADAYSTTVNLTAIGA